VNGRSPDLPVGPGVAPATQAAPDTVQLCSFVVGGERYVIDIMRIREIVSPLPVTPVRRSSPLVEGVIDLRGQVIPLVDLRKALGVPPVGLDRGSKHVIVSVGGGVVGLTVDAMGRVLTVPRSAIQVAPALVAGDEATIFPGVLNHADGLYLLLDLKALLAGGLPRPGEVDRMRDAALGGGP
jgi:purine-binding chemotaxis protein CheW